MIIQLQKNISSENSQTIYHELEKQKYAVTAVNTQFENYLICIGKADIDIRSIGHLKGIKDIHGVSDSYKLVSRKWKTDYTKIDLGDNIVIGDGIPTLMAGPCSIESESQVASIVQHLEKNNLHIMRGGVFKPRSSPYAFRGLGIDGLKMMYSQCKPKKIKIITEVMQVSQIAEMFDYVDVFQVGARNSQNYNLLDALGEVDKPVLIKRGISGTVEELLHSAEYIFSKGNERLMLCERGIRTFETIYRNTFDINAIQILKDRSHLPVIADPSHGIGLREYVPKLAIASLFAGADGVIYEVHEKPEEAVSDGQQTLNFMESEEMINKINTIKHLV